MEYIVISREQVSNKLNREICNDKTSAYNRRKMLINTYNDVVVLSIDEFKNLIDPIWNGPSEELLKNISKN